MPPTLRHIRPLTRFVSATQVFVESKQGSQDVDYLERYERSPGKSDVKTYWWETKAPDRILSPPDLSRRHELSEGDVFVHRYGTHLNNGGERQDMWIWASERGGNLHWKLVKQGYKRADGRVLALTEGRKLPSWLDREWYLKRLAQGKHGSSMMSVVCAYYICQARL